jgi:AAA+ superfamily predicted ATPase
MEIPVNERRADDYSQVALWLDRLTQIDRLLKASVPTLIDVAEWSINKGKLLVPLYVSDRETAADRRFLLPHAISTSTILRLYKVKRRFAWLDDSRRSTLRELKDTLPAKLLPPDKADRTSLDFLDHLGSDLFGALNPLTASEMFWVFIRAGERYAHSGVGFLAFFSMLWSMSRRYPDATEAGAALEPSGPTATVTAKCLIAIDALSFALRQRGSLYQRISDLISSADDAALKTGPRASWEFAFALDRLAGAFFEISPYTIVQHSFVRAGEELVNQAKALGPKSNTTDIWTGVRKLLAEALFELRKEQTLVFRDAEKVVHRLLPKVVKLLEPDAPHEQLWKYCHQLRHTDEEAYWKDHNRAAKVAQAFVAQCLEKLRAPFEKLQTTLSAKAPTTKQLTTVISALCQSNLDVGENVQQVVGESVQWARRCIMQESALSSAGNQTEFDPAGLVSAIAVAQKWDQISFPQAEDGIRRALAGALSDGSWSRGQPIFLRDRVEGVWPHTPDVVWILAVALNAEPRLTIADDALFRFVDWLERNKTRFWWSDGKRHVQAWSSELDRIDKIIDIWISSVSINALLEIRDLVESRLWAVCKTRFTVLHELRPLEKVDPTDVGAVHDMRLHRRLMKMARMTELDEDYEKQDYSLVLHGPPGSSKTAIAEALGEEMWRTARRDPRVVRITPSDFTRQGEGRLDFEARFIFDLLGHLRGVTILFDEIDDFLRQRDPKEEPAFIKLIVPAMLNRLQDLRDAAPRQQICFLLATNFVDKIEPALLRPGRIDSAIPVTYPDAWSRHAIIEKHVGEKSRITQAQTEMVVQATGGWPWGTFNKLARRLAQLGRNAPINDDDITELVKQLQEQFQNTDSYYYDDLSRWRKPCPALVNEFVHTTFSLSKKRDVCRDEVGRLVGLLDSKGVSVVNLRFFEAFERQATAEKR